MSIRASTKGVAGWRALVAPGATRHLRLATEDEMATAFPSYDVGALPPVGPMLPAPGAIDIRLLFRERGEDPRRAS